MNTNLLVDKLPNEYEGLKVNTNFRSFILFELLMQDNSLTREEKIGFTLNLFYDEEVIDIKKAIDVVLWFYCCGKEKNNKKSINNDSDTIRNKIYSYEYDSEYIYSAFKDQYGIDLNEIKYLHWFKFKAMFNSLKSDNKICEIMSYRAIDLNKIKDKDEKNKYKKLKKIWALPDNRSEREKENDFAEAFW